MQSFINLSKLNYTLLNFTAQQGDTDSYFLDFTAHKDTLTPISGFHGPQGHTDSSLNHNKVYSIQPITKQPYNSSITLNSESRECREKKFDQNRIEFGRV